MVKILKGDIVSNDIKNKIKNDIENLKINDKVPTLAFVTLGNDIGTQSYIKSKKKDCDYCGVKLFDYILDECTTTEQLLQIIFSLNKDENINGIIIGMPLPVHIDKTRVLSSIHPLKDIDCLSNINIGKLVNGTQKLLPCTPAGIIEMLHFYNIKIEGSKCVVVGRSNIVGKPLAMLLINNNGTVTICHSKTKNLTEICKTADILVCATGNTNTITKNMVKQNATIIDVGVNRIQNKIVGDVDFENVKEVVGAITPVPGGVGILTRTMLIKNTLIAFKMQNNLTI